ncbi:MAG: methionine--tRNA ligase [Bacilli bacterium]|nr:methionine--tRNA ligase [Bacilli bacterium]
MKTRFYITTPIYYPSGNAHIGHAYCTTICDILARNKRLRGFETRFLTGTDEHGQKIKEHAAKAGKEPQPYVDEIVASFQKLWRLMEISNDDFIRTTEPRHIKVVQTMFSNMLKKGDIYLGTYKGWYCTECEAFWTDIQAGPEHLCPDCHRPVHEASEESYFFKCSKYVDELLKAYKDNPKLCFPASRMHEMVNTFIKPGLQDLSVSRTSNDWGVTVLENPKHTVYVWLDALANYLSALGYGSEKEELYKKFWEDEKTEIIHIIGADISRFHCIYWPMFLMSAGLRLPDRVFVHGLLKIKDEKMSKSKGNVVSPYPLVEKYGVDAVRYYLAREVTFGRDGEFTPEQFVERLNVDLANQLGNLLNRTVSMINKYFNGEIPAYKAGVTKFDTEIENMILGTIKQYEIHFDDLQITEGVTDAMNLVARANKYIDETAPWVLAKENELDELAAVMSHLANVLYVAAILLSPVLVHKANEILDQLNVPTSLRNYQSIQKVGVIEKFKVNKGAQLFPRLDVKAEIEYIKGLMK